MCFLNGQGLFAGAMSGLTNTYSALAQYNTSNNSNSKGISLKDLTNPSTDILNQIGYNNTFLSYLSSNFNTIDKDGDGVIGSDDLNKYMQTMQKQGLTYNEIVQLCSSGQMGGSLSETVLTYFNKIDKDGDGRITSEEISSFGYEAQRQKMETQYNSFKKSSMTTFYGDESDSNETPTSVLDSMYPDLSSS